MIICISLPTVVEGDLKDSFSIVTILGCSGERSSFPGLLHLPGIEFLSPGQLAKSLTLMPMGRFNPKSSLTKDSKMVRDVSLLNTYDY